MAPRRAAIAALALATSCLLLVTAGAAPTKDGFLVPLASNDAWDYYEFNLTTKVTITSGTPFNTSGGAKDLNAPGGTITGTSQVFNSKGELVGINQFVRNSVGAVYDMPGLKGTRVYNFILVIHYELGTAEKGYFDDSLVANVVSKRYFSAKPQEEFVDYDAAISGGTGRFMGATGSVVVSPTKMVRSSLMPLSTVTQFRVWVPRNLPTPKGAISGRRRSL